MPTDNTTTLKAYQVFLKTDELSEQYAVVANSSAEAVTQLANKIGVLVTGNERITEGNGPVPDAVAKDAGLDLTLEGDYRRMPFAVFTRDLA